MRDVTHSFSSRMKEYCLSSCIFCRVLNHVMKKGAASANTLGSIAVIYSGFGVLIETVRGAEDELNTLAAATLTGMLFRSTCK